MLEGLEAVELKLSNVLDDNYTGRIDSEYFKKSHLDFLNWIVKKDFSILEDIGDVKGGKRLPLGEEFSDVGIPYIRAEDNKKGFVDYNQSPRISEALHSRLKQYQTTYNDILLTNVGNSIGDVGIIKFFLEKCNLTENCIKIVDICNQNPNYIFSFLNSKYGMIQIKRETVGTAQPKLAIERIRQFKIPILLEDFQNKIEELVKLSYQKLETSKALYTEAETILLDELGLVDFEPSQEAVNIKSLKNSFVETGRLDAEYYQLKYEEIIERVKSKPFDKLDNIVNIKKSIEPGSDNYSDDGVDFVRVSNITKFGLSKPDIKIPYSFFGGYLNLQHWQPTKDTILLSKDGTVGIAYKIKGQTDIVTSGALLHLTVMNNLKDEILSEYLTLVLNSKIVSMQAERDAGGSIIQHWKPSEIKEVIIPKVDISIQQQIEEKVQESFRLKKQSEELLEVAKRSVEIAIEQDEAVALRYIQSNTLHEIKE